jgi:flagellar motility protein MotE (MotC chaperone)
MILIRPGIDALAGVCVAALLASSPASAQEAAKPKAAPESEIARYCTAIAPGAGEARATYQLRRLSDLQVEVREAVEKLESKENEAREWVTKRESMMKSATDEVVAIYAKMPAEAAAPQLAAMDDNIAAAVLSKLKPGLAGAILAEMQSEKAARLSLLIAGAAPSDKS